MNNNEIIQLINSIIDKRENYNGYNPSVIPYHTHNGTDSPLIPFNGILGISIFTASGNLSDEIVVLANTTDGAITLTLPSAIGNDGRQFIIKDWKGKSSVNPITMQPSLSQTIDGASTKTINANYSSFYVISDGANWSIL